MKDNSIFNFENDIFKSVFPQGDTGLFDLRKLNLSDEKNGSFTFTFLIELIQRVEHSMESIRNFTQLSRGKFSDRAFGDHFQRIINEETEKVNLALGCVRNYIKVNQSIKKSNTVHTLIEEVIKKHQIQISGKKIRVLKKFEEDLPETSVPDEHLRYILDSILKYAIGLMPLNGGVGFITRSFIHQRESGETGLSSINEGKYVEVSVLFDGYRKGAAPSGTLLQPEPPGKKEALDLEMRLIDEMVGKNKGMLEFGIDARKGRTLISLRFPIERRNIVYYQSIN